MTLPGSSPQARHVQHSDVQNLDVQNVDVEDAVPAPARHSLEVEAPPLVGSARRSRLNRRAVAPIAALAVVALATGGTLAAPRPGIAAGDVSFASAPARSSAISRDLTRTPIAAASASATPSVPTTPSAASMTPSARASAPSASATATTKKLAVTGLRYATASLNVRSGPSASASRVASLTRGARVSIVGPSVGGWQRVRIKGTDAWVKASYLSKSKPAVVTVARTSSSTPAASTTGVSLGACASGSAVESGMTAAGDKVHRAVCHAFPSITSYGGYRSGDGMHSRGRAIDIMVSGSLGWKVAEYVRAHASELGVTEVIYSQRIWTTQRASEGWRALADRGSVTANHYDHVHVTV